MDQLYKSPMIIKEREIVPCFIHEMKTTQPTVICMVFFMKSIDLKWGKYDILAFKDDSFIFHRSLVTCF